MTCIPAVRYKPWTGAGMPNGDPGRAIHTQPLNTTGNFLSRGFTIIELLVVMAVLAVLASLVAPRYMDKVQTAKEVALRQNLQGLRTGIDQFYRDQSRYPENLAELVTKRYIRVIPADPITESATTWVPVSPKEGGNGVFDIKSGAQGRARDGSSYGTW